MKLRLWGVLVVTAAAAGEDAAGLKEDLRFAERLASPQYQMNDLVDRVLAALRRKHPGLSMDVDVAEARISAARAEREPNAQRSRELTDRARGLYDKIERECQDPLSGALVRVKLERLKFERGDAQQTKSKEKFAELLKSFEALDTWLWDFETRIEEALREKRKSKEECEMLGTEAFFVHAETFYEWGQTHLLQAREAKELSPEERSAELDGAVERFGQATDYCEPETPDPSKTPIGYPQAYLGKAEAEREKGDLDAARETLRQLMDRPIDRPADAQAAWRVAALEMVAALSIREKNWKQAAEVAAAVRKQPRGAERADLLMARVQVEKSLADKEGGAADWKKPFDAGIQGLAAAAERKGATAEEAAEWIKTYRERAGETIQAAPTALGKAREAYDAKNYKEALPLFQEVLTQIGPRDWEAKAFPAIEGIAYSLYQLERFPEAVSAAAAMLDHPGASPEKAVRAARIGFSSMQKWAAVLKWADPLDVQSPLSGPAHAILGRSIERFPEETGTRALIFSVAQNAYKRKEWPEALVLYARIRPEEADYAQSLGRIVSCQRQMLAQAREKAGKRGPPTPEEVAPLQRAYDLLEKWLGGPQGRQLKAPDRDEIARQAVGDCAVIFCQAIPDRALKMMEGFEGRFAGAKPETLELIRNCRCIALAGALRVPEAKKLLGEILGSTPPGQKPPDAVLAAVKALFQICSRRADDLPPEKAALIQEYKQWKRELFVTMVGVEENPTAQQVEKLLGAMVGQIRDGEHELAIDLGELVLEKAAQWKVEERVRLQFEDQLSIACVGALRWERALAVAGKLFLFYWKQEERAIHWKAGERSALAARSAAEAEKDPAKRRMFLDRWYEFYTYLWESAEESEKWDEWWRYCQEMGLARLAQARAQEDPVQREQRYGMLCDFLRAVFGRFQDLGGGERQAFFVDLMSLAGRSAQEKARAQAWELLDDVWKARVIAADPLVCLLVQ